MSYCKNGAIICDNCSKFCNPYDEETPFGSKNYDDPEPLDPSHYCKPCSKLLYKEWLKKLQDKRNWHYGMWQKSNAERRAAEKLGLVWLHSHGIGTYGTETDRQPYQYITKKEHEQLSKLPRFISKTETPT